MMRRVGAVLAGLLMGSSQVHAQAVQEFRQVMTVHQQGTDGLQRVPLPWQVYESSARPDLGDLRVFNSRGERVPFAHAEPAAASAMTPEGRPLPFFPLRERPSASTTGSQVTLQVRQQSDGTLVSLAQQGPAGSMAQKKVHAYLVDASALRAPVSALVFEWTPTDETRSGQVQVEASSDLRQWRVLVADAPLMSLAHAGAQLERKRVALPPGKVRYFRLSWRGPVFDLRGLSAELSAPRPLPALATRRIRAERGGVEGEFLFDIGGSPPVETVSLKLPVSNSVVPTRLEARARKDDPWRPIVQASFYRLNREGVEIESPAIALNPAPLRYWRAVQDARAGSAGVDAPDLEVGWQPRSIVYAARGDGPYQVAWGNPDARPEALRLSELMPGYTPASEHALPVSRLEAVVTQGVHDRSVPERLMNDMSRQLTARTALLWIILVGGVGFLGIMAWQLGRQVTGSTPDGSGEPPASVQPDDKTG